MQFTKTRVPNPDVNKPPKPRSNTMRRTTWSYRKFASRDVCLYALITRREFEHVSLTADAHAAQSVSDEHKQSGRKKK